MKQQITRISILQSSKIVTALYFLFGCLYSLIGIPMILFGGTELQIMGFIYLFMPLLVGVLAFVFFALFAWIYNLLAGWLGGFEFELNDMDLSQPDR